jgi:hypothetical protein
MRGCRTPQERLFFQQTILDRMIAYAPFQETNEADLSKQLVVECLERLRYEGNTGLLNTKEFPSILEELQCRVDEIRSVERSRLGRGIFQIRQRYRFAKVIYPKSPMLRVAYQIRHLFEMIGKMGKLLRPR